MFANKKLLEKSLDEIEMDNIRLVAQMENEALVDKNNQLHKEFEMEAISENVSVLRKQIKEKDACISMLQVKPDNLDKLAEYLIPEQIDEMIKAVEVVRRMDKHQRQRNEYYREWRKR